MRQRPGLRITRRQNDEKKRTCQPSAARPPRIFRPVLYQLSYLGEITKVLVYWARTLPIPTRSANFSGTGRRACKSFFERAGGCIYDRGNLVAVGAHPRKRIVSECRSRQYSKRMASSSTSPRCSKAMRAPTRRSSGRWGCSCSIWYRIIPAFGCTHCHLNVHLQLGMVARYQVVPLSGRGPALDRGQPIKKRANRRRILAEMRSSCHECATIGGVVVLTR